MNTKAPYKTLIFLVILAVFAILIAMPAKLPINFPFFGRQISYTFERPPLDLTRYRIPFYRDLDLHIC
jgi:hypothetical protein